MSPLSGYFRVGRVKCPHGCCSLVDQWPGGWLAVLSPAQVVVGVGGEEAPDHGAQDGHGRGQLLVHCARHRVRVSMCETSSMHARGTNGYGRRALSPVLSSMSFRMEPLGHVGSSPFAQSSGEALSPGASTVLRQAML